MRISPFTDGLKGEGPSASSDQVSAHSQLPHCIVLQVICVGHLQRGHGLAKVLRGQVHIVLHFSCKQLHSSGLMSTHLS